MGSSVVSLRIDDEDLDKYDAIADQTRLARSEVLRQAIEVGMEQLAGEDDAWTPPEHLEILSEREEVLKKNKVEYLRGGFRNRVYQQFKHLFSQNWSPSELERVVEGYRDEIDVLFSDDERIEELNDFVDHLLEEYREAYEKSDYDPFEDSFEDFTGVKDDGDTDRIYDLVETEMGSEIRHRIDRGTPQKEVVDELQDDYDLSVKRAVDVVDTILNR